MEKNWRIKRETDYIKKLTINLITTDQGSTVLVCRNLGHAPVHISLIKDHHFPILGKILKHFRHMETF